MLMIHSNIHFIYESAVQCCGRSDVAKNKTQEKTITEGRNLGITKPTVKAPVALIHTNPYKFLSLRLMKISVAKKQKAIE